MKTHKKTKRWRIVLDTEAKLLDYASRFMHRPVTMDELRFEPFTLDCVKLLCGRDALRDWSDKIKTLAHAQKEQNDKESFNLDMFETMTDLLAEKTFPTNLGIVDGVAADVINAWKAKQATK